MVGAVLMDMIDITIINVALPTIGRDLEASGTQLEWVVSAYMLAFAAALIVAGTSATSSVASASSSAISGSAGVLWGYTAPVPRLPR
jgi:MFS family permease